MNSEAQAHKQALRVIISEIIMVITVIIMVIVLALIVSGYWFNANFEVERQGMLQINSIPTGANIEVDGDSPWYQRTNTSKILSADDHTIILTKDGYDTWTKTIHINEGLLYRIQYPRLFLQDRYKEKVYDVPSTTFATVSPNGKILLLANNTTSWSLVDLDSDTIKSSTIDISNYFSNIASTEKNYPGLFTGTIVSASWDNDNEHILFKVTQNNKNEWVLIDIKNPTRSINLSREFAIDFTQINIMNHSASNLLAIQDGNLRKIDTNSRQMSAIIASVVESFDYYDSEIAYIANGDVNIIKHLGNNPVTITQITSPAKVLFSKFYDNRYLITTESNNISVYEENSNEPFFTASISFTPSTIKVGPSSDFIFMNHENLFATLDMESMQIKEWSIDTESYEWLDGYMVYTVNEGALTVYDYDGLNARTIATNVSSHYPVAITNNKWLYYFSDNSLVREWLIAK